MGVLHEMQRPESATARFGPNSSPTCAFFFCTQVTAKEKTAVHHNQASTLKSNKNASKSVRDKLKEQQAAAAICDEAKRKVYTHTGVGGPSS